LCRN